MPSDKTKVTVIIETRKQKRTITYNSAFDVKIGQHYPDRAYHSSDFGGGFALPRPEWMEVELSMVLGKDEEGNYQTLTVEQLDPVPDDIREIITKATQHNINDERREKLIKELIKLVETDRKENSK